MTYRVRVLARARHDLDGFIASVAERSPEGAARLLARFEDALAKLETNPFVAYFVQIHEEVPAELRQKFGPR